MFSKPPLLLSFSGVGPGPNLLAEGEKISEGDLQFRTRWDCLFLNLSCLNMLWLMIGYGLAASFQNNPRRKAQGFWRIFNKNEACFCCLDHCRLWDRWCFCVFVFRLSQKPTPEFVLPVAVTCILSNFPLNAFESSLLPVNWQFQMFVPQKVCLFST